MAAHNYTEEKLASLRARLNHLVSESNPSQLDTSEELDTVPILDDSFDGQEQPDQLTLRQSYKRSSFPVEEYAAGLLSGLSPPPLSLGSSTVDSQQSSTESGFATMDTERSVVGENGEGLQPSEETVEGDQAEELLKTGHDEHVVQEIDSVTSEEPQQSIVDDSFVPAADVNKSEPTVANSSEDLSNTPTTSKLSVDTSLPSGSEDLASSTPTNADQNGSKLPGSMSPLAVDVSQDPSTEHSDHQTPPTVEDLAPTLPITDQEKLNVANRSKRGKKNRRKGKNKRGAAAVAESKPVPTSSSSPNQSQTDINEKCDQSTLTDSIDVENAELQTDSTKLLSNSFTNTEPYSHTQSQTDLVPTADQSTRSDSQDVFSQGTLAGRPRTSSATNQTEPLSSNDQLIETEQRAVGGAPGQMDSNLHDDSMTSRSTNTSIHVSSYSQTDLFMAPAAASDDCVLSDNVQTQTELDAEKDLSVDAPVEEDDGYREVVGSSLPLPKDELPYNDLASHRDEVPQEDEDSAADELHFGQDAQSALDNELPADDEVLDERVTDQELPVEDEDVGGDMAEVKEAVVQETVLVQRRPEHKVADAAPAMAAGDELLAKPIVR